MWLNLCMDIVNLKNLIDQVLKLDFSNVYKPHTSKQSWGNFTDAELEIYVKSIIATLKKLKSKDEKFFAKMGPNKVSNLTTHLQDLLNQYNGNLAHTPYGSITNHHHIPLNALENIRILLENISIMSAPLTRKDKLEENEVYQELTKTLKDFKEQKKNFDEVLTFLNEFIQKKNEAREVSIQGQAAAYQSIAIKYDNEETKQWWIIGAISSGVMAFCTAFFLLFLGEELTVGDTIFRVAILTIPTYFLYFASSQFLHNKKIYEKFTLRHAILETMKDLLSIHGEKYGEKIMEKATDVIFSEIDLKDSNKPPQNQVFDDMVKPTDDPNNPQPQ